MREARNARDTILREAVRAFGERGYHGTSMRQVAVASHLQKPSLYYWFASKRALWEGVVDEAIED